MVIELFIAMLLIGFILTIMAIETEGVAYCGIGLVIWLLLFVQSLWIVSDTSGNVYHEFGLSALCLAFIFVHIILLILVFVEPAEPGLSLWESLTRRR